MDLNQIKEIASGLQVKQNLHNRQNNKYPSDAKVKPNLRIQIISRKIHWRFERYYTKPVFFKQTIHVLVKNIYTCVILSWGVITGVRKNKTA